MLNFKIPDKYNGEFSIHGDWHYSTAFESPMFSYPDTMWANGKEGDYVKYNPQISAVGNIRISAYLPPQQEHLNKKMCFEIHHNGKVDTVFTDDDSFKNEPTWLCLGEFDFCGDLNEFVVAKRIGSIGNTRISTLHFEILNSAGDGTVWQNLYLGPVAEGREIKEAKTVKTYTDLTDHKHSYEIYFLEQLDCLKTDSDAFCPDETITGDVFCEWLSALAKQDIKGENKALDIKTAAEFIHSAIKNSNKNLEWIEDWAEDSYELLKNIEILPTVSPFDNKNHSLTRADACVLLKNFYTKFVSSGVSADEWELSFHDEFNNGYNYDLWLCESGVPGHILSSRWLENGEVKDGKLRLLTKKEKVAAAPDRDWTTGSVGANPNLFKQRYGYWEASIKINASTGLNNAFWMIDSNHKFEIDIVEAHYPNAVNTNLHAGGVQYSERYPADYDLSADFHTYGLLWTETELIYYFDGEEISRKVNVDAHNEVVPRFSTAVLNWAGQITDKANGCAMEIDWIRIYKRK